MRDVLLAMIVFGDTHGHAFPVVDAIVGEQNIDAVIHTGDITDDRSDDQMDQMSLAMDRIPFPVVATRGNHDNLHAFRRHFGRTPQVHVLDHDVALVVLDSNLSVEPQIRYVRSLVDSNPTWAYVVVVHHPPLQCSANGNSRGGWASGLSDVLRPWDLVVCGHGHVHCEYELDSGTQVILTANAWRKRYSCLSEIELPDDALCDTGPQREYVRLFLLDNLSWTWERIGLD